MHGEPKGLSVVTVRITISPPSAATGVYVNENGDTADDTGFKVPAPFEVIITLVAEPLKVFPVTVTTVVPQTLPVLLLKVTAGGFIHSHDTVKRVPVVVHPGAFLTDK
jgi:hypothetical protein